MLKVILLMMLNQVFVNVTDPVELQEPESGNAKCTEFKNPCPESNISLGRNTNIDSLDFRATERKDAWFKKIDPIDFHKQENTDTFFIEQYKSNSLYSSTVTKTDTSPITPIQPLGCWVEVVCESIGNPDE